MANYTKYLGVIEFDQNQKLTNITILGDEDEDFEKLTEQGIRLAQNMNNAIISVVKIYEYNPVAIFPDDKGKTTKVILENYK